MADKPIIFSAPMVRALLDGRKTQTRRVLKPQPVWDNGAIGIEDKAGRWVFCSNTERGFGEGLPRSRFKLPYAPGDRLYVREAVCWVSRLGWRYRADDDDLSDKREAGEVGRWHPSIHMPRWASRLTLTVTDVRVQRLAEMSSGDALAEGIDVTGDCGPLVTYAKLWDNLNAKRGFLWQSNPWVVALTFRTELNSDLSLQ